jgi:hypothetical protein
VGWVGAADHEAQQPDHEQDHGGNPKEMDHEAQHRQQNDNGKHSQDDLQDHWLFLLRRQLAGLLPAPTTPGPVYAATAPHQAELARSLTAPRGAVRPPFER